MASIAAFGLTVADGWSVSVGGGWIAAMMIAMALFCAAGMLFMWLMPGGRHGFMCGLRWSPRPPTGPADGGSDGDEGSR